jgi:hypothetical protein
MLHHQSPPVWIYAECDSLQVDHEFMLPNGTHIIAGATATGIDDKCILIPMIPENIIEQQRATNSGPKG